MGPIGAVALMRSEEPPVSMAINISLSEIPRFFEL